MKFLADPRLRGLVSTRRSRRGSSVRELEVKARAVLPRMIYDYVAGGAEAEWSLNANAAEFDRWAFVPRVLRDVSSRQTNSRLFGIDHRLPVIISPTGLSGALWPKGEAAAARAAVGRGVSMMVSAAATEDLESIALASGDASRLLFQLFVYKDRQFTESLVRRAKAAGYGGLVVTVDVPMTGRRARDERNGFTIPPTIKPKQLFDVMRRTSWLRRMYPPWRITFENFRSVSERGANALTLGQIMGDLADPSVTWKEIEWIRAIWDGPLIVKGILSPQDAVMAVECGVDGVVVSNHGGRQLDKAIPPLLVLQSVRESVGDKLTILIDGSVTTGRDILTALALGADGACIGRAHLWGLAVGGQDGVEQVLDILRTELDSALAMTGLASIDSASCREIVVNVETVLRQCRG